MTHWTCQQCLTEGQGVGPKVCPWCGSEDVLTFDPVQEYHASIRALAATPEFQAKVRRNTAMLTFVPTKSPENCKKCQGTGESWVYDPQVNGWDPTGGPCGSCSWASHLDPEPVGV